MQILSNTLALIVVLSVVVVVHEFGHFAVAKSFRFPVEVFSVGFGKRLFGKKWRGTDYRFSAIPLGGYVRVIGLGPDESTIAEGTSTEAPAVGKRWQRGLILLAGPAMNFVLAFLLHTTVFVVGERIASLELEPPVVQVILPGYPAEAAGFQPGDRVVSINGTATPRWRDVQFIFGMNAREPLAVTVNRGGTDVVLHVTPQGDPKYDLGLVGIGPERVRFVLYSVIPGSPAEKAGLKAGDVLVSVAGRDIKGLGSGNALIEAALAAAPAGPVAVEYVRDGKTATAMVVPRQASDGFRRIGVDAGTPRILVKFPLGQAFVEGWRRVETDFRMTLSILGRLFRGRASMKSMSGPLDIAKFSGEAARTGAVPLVGLMAAISLQLGIFNLLPIPVLDGGHLFLLGMESVARRDFSLRVKERILQVGFVMILALLAVVLYNDLAKNLPSGWWPFSQ